MTRVTCHDAAEPPRDRGGAALLAAAAPPLGGDAAAARAAGPRHALARAAETRVGRRGQAAGGERGGAGGESVPGRHLGLGQDRARAEGF